MAGHNVDDNSRSQRIAAMRELAGNTQAPGKPTASSPTPNRAPRKRLILTAVMVIAVLASAGAEWKGLFPWQRQQSKSASNVTSINLAADNLFCPSYAAWSPDGQRVAVLAKVGACGNAYAGIFTQDVVAILDTRGYLVRQIDVDASISGYTKASTASSLVYLQFWGLAWASEGKRVALPFTMMPGPENTTPLAESGVVVAPLDGSPVVSFTRSPFYAYDYWDIQAKQVIHGSTSQPIALAYQWSADGELVAAPDPSAMAPVGNPSGGQSFTIWQPGTVVLDRKTSALNFGGIVTALSPNGRYLVPLVGFGGELDPSAAGYTKGSDGQFRLAPRDKGLMAAAVQLKDASDPSAARISAAWRADGKLIAATDPNPLIDQVVANLGPDIPATRQGVTMFDCATGAKLLTLKTQPLANRLQLFGGGTYQPALGWNAQGDRLFFLDTNFDALTIWNVSLK